MSIKLNGYRAAVPNEVYYKDGTLLRNTKPQIEIQSIILLQKYTLPVLEDVMSSIVADAEYCCEKFDYIRHYYEFNVLTDTQKILSGFNKKTLERIASSDKDAIEFLKSRSLSDPIPRTYLRVGCWVIPHIEVKRTGFDTQQKWEDFLDSQYIDGNGFGQKADIRILVERCLLPPSSALKKLVKHGTFGSKTMKIEPHNYNQNAVSKVIDAIHPDLWNLMNSSKIRDVSEESLKFEAYETVKAALNDSLAGQEERPDVLPSPKEPEQPKMTMQ